MLSRSRRKFFGRRGPNSQRVCTSSFEAPSTTLSTSRPTNIRIDVRCVSSDDDDDDESKQSSNVCLHEKRTIYKDSAKAVAVSQSTNTALTKGEASAVEAIVHVSHNEESKKDCSVPPGSAAVSTESSIDSREEGDVDEELSADEASVHGEWSYSTKRVSRTGNGKICSVGSRMTATTTTASAYSTITAATSTSHGSSTEPGVHGRRLGQIRASCRSLSSSADSSTTETQPMADWLRVPRLHNVHGRCSNRSREISSMRHGSGIRNTDDGDGPGPIKSLSKLAKNSMSTISTLEPTTVNGSSATRMVRATVREVTEQTNTEAQAAGSRRYSQQRRRNSYRSSPASSSISGGTGDTLHSSRSSWASSFGGGHVHNTFKKGLFKYSNVDINDLTLYSARTESVMSSRRSSWTQQYASHDDTNSIASSKGSTLRRYPSMRGSRRDDQAASGSPNISSTSASNIMCKPYSADMYQCSLDVFLPAWLIDNNGIKSSSPTTTTSLPSDSAATTPISRAPSNVGDSDKTRSDMGEKLYNGGSLEVPVQFLRLQARVSAGVLLMVVVMQGIMMIVTREPWSMLMAVSSASQLVVLRRWGTTHQRVHWCIWGSLVTLMLVMTLPIMMAVNENQRKVIAVAMTDLLPMPLCLIILIVPESINRSKLALTVLFVVSAIPRVLAFVYGGWVDPRDDAQAAQTQPKGGYDHVVALIMSLMLQAGTVVFSSLIVQHHSEHRRMLEEMLYRVRKANQKVRHARDVAVSNSKLKSQFLANMSHEIRTPLHAIISMTCLMKRSRPLTYEQHEYLDTTTVSADSLMLLLNDILDFSKIEAGKLMLENSTFCLHRAIGESVKALSAKAHAKGLVTDILMGEDVPIIAVGDVTRLKQIITNLVSNAIKFTTNGGYVLVQAWIQKEQRLDDEIHKSNIDKVRECIMRSNNDICIHLVVSDTGIGVPKNKSRLIFESFAQGEGTTTTKQYGGTGLGLSISKQLVELNNGCIWVDTNINRSSHRNTGGPGCQFHFIWPLLRFKNASKSEEVASIVGDLRVPSTLSAPFMNEFLNVESSTGTATLHRIMDDPVFEPLRSAKLMVVCTCYISRTCCENKLAQLCLKSNSTFYTVQEFESKCSSSDDVSAYAVDILLIDYEVAISHRQQAENVCGGDLRRVILMKTCENVRMSVGSSDGANNSLAFTTAGSGFHSSDTTMVVPSDAATSGVALDTISTGRPSVTSLQAQNVAAFSVASTMVTPVLVFDLLVRILEIQSPELLVTAATGGEQSRDLPMVVSGTDSVNTTCTAIGGRPRLSEREKLRILVIDDNKINLKVAARILQKLGYVAVIRDSGMKGLQVFREQVFDAVLLDICMPDMDGMETARYIRRIEQEAPMVCDDRDTTTTPNVLSHTTVSSRATSSAAPTHKTRNYRRTPIIAATANALKGNKKLFEEAGMDGYISKPYLPESLQAAIRNTIHRVADQQDHGVRARMLYAPSTATTTTKTTVDRTSKNEESAHNIEMTYKAGNEDNV